MSFIEFITQDEKKVKVDKRITKFSELINTLHENYETEMGAPLTGINSGKELKLLDGNIHTAASSASQEFVIIVWIDSSKVLISDTINRDSNNRAIAVDDLNKELVAAKEEDVGKLVYRTNEFSKKSISIKIKAINF